jgi:hypothetical protein
MLAHAFLAVLRAQSQTLVEQHATTASFDDQNTYQVPHTREEPTIQTTTLVCSAVPLLPVMDPLSFPEIRRLFFYLLQQPPFPLLFRLTWSFFASARLCHYKRRLAATL